jgi:hypothetical protein
MVPCRPGGRGVDRTYLDRIHEKKRRREERVGTLRKQIREGTEKEIGKETRK